MIENEIHSKNRKSTGGTEIVLIVTKRKGKETGGAIMNKREKVANNGGARSGITILYPTPFFQ